MVVKLARSSASSSDHDLSMVIPPYSSHFLLLYTVLSYRQLLTLPTTIVHPTKLVAMDPRSLFLGILGLATIILNFKSRERVLISRTYGTTLGWFSIIYFGKTATEYERISRVVLRGTDEEALRFRGAVTSECNMTAVAVSVSTFTVSVDTQPVCRAPLSPKLRSRRSPSQA